MAERILRLHLFGVVTELAHLPDDSSVTLETTQDVDGSVEWTNIHVRSSSLPAFAEASPISEPDDNASLPVTTERTMVPRDSLILDPTDVTVEELKDILRDKDLPVSGTKAELIERLNEAATDDAG